MPRGAFALETDPLPADGLVVVAARLRRRAPVRRQHWAPAGPSASCCGRRRSPRHVTVTAGRRELRGADTPAATTVVTSAELLSSAATTVDDALRFTPGFTLFRRSSSRAANPTTQGVTLRGLSASGASRTLVLADGVPLNDAVRRLGLLEPRAAGGDRAHRDRPRRHQRSLRRRRRRRRDPGRAGRRPADAGAAVARRRLARHVARRRASARRGSARRHRRRRRAVRHRRRADHRRGGARPDRHAGGCPRVVVAGERGVGARRPRGRSRWSAPASRASTRTAPTARRSRSTTPTSTRAAFAPAASSAAAPGRRPASRRRRPTISRSPRSAPAGPARA